MKTKIILVMLILLIAFPIFAKTLKETQLENKLGIVYWIKGYTGAYIDIDSINVNALAIDGKFNIDGYIKTDTLIVDMSGQIASGKILSFNGSTATNYLQFSTNLNIVGSADILLDPAGGDVDVDAADVWIDSGNYLSVNGSTGTATLLLDTDVKLNSPTDIQFIPTGKDVLIDGGLTVGSTTQAGDNNLRVEGASTLSGNVNVKNSSLYIIGGTSADSVYFVHDGNSIILSDPDSSTDNFELEGLGLELWHGATITNPIAERVELGAADSFVATYFKGELVGNAATCDSANFADAALMADSANYAGFAETIDTTDAAFTTYTAKFIEMWSDTFHWGSSTIRRSKYVAGIQANSFGFVYNIGVSDSIIPQNYWWVWSKDDSMIVQARSADSTSTKNKRFGASIFK